MVNGQPTAHKDAGHAHVEEIKDKNQGNDPSAKNGVLALYLVSCRQDRPDGERHQHADCADHEDHAASNAVDKEGEHSVDNESPCPDASVDA